MGSVLDKEKRLLLVENQLNLKQDPVSDQVGDQRGPRGEVFNLKGLVDLVYAAEVFHFLEVRALILDVGQRVSICIPCACVTACVYKVPSLYD